MVTFLWLIGVCQRFVEQISPTVLVRFQCKLVPMISIKVAVSSLLVFFLQPGSMSSSMFLNMCVCAPARAFVHA